MKIQMFGMVIIKTIGNKSWRYHYSQALDRDYWIPIEDLKEDVE